MEFSSFYSKLLLNPHKSSLRYVFVSNICDCLPYLDVGRRKTFFVFSLLWQITTRLLPIISPYKSKNSTTPRTFVSAPQYLIIIVKYSFHLKNSDIFPPHRLVIASTQFFVYLTTVSQVSPACPAFPLFIYSTLMPPTRYLHTQIAIQ